MKYLIRFALFSWLVHDVFFLEVPLGHGLAWGWVIGLVSSIVSGVSNKKAADKQADADKAAAELNAAAHLANSKLNAAITRFDAISPKYQAMMDATNSRTNAKIMGLNSTLASGQGELRSQETILQAKYIMADALQAGEGFDLQAFEAVTERSDAADQYQQDIDDVEKAGRQKKALARVAYASMGISLDSGQLDALDLEIVNETEEEVASVMLSKAIEMRSAGKVYKEAKTRAKQSVSAGERSSKSLVLQSELIRQETELQVLLMDAEAQKYLASGEYMDWYADFVETSSDMKASILETGAEIAYDNAFAVAAAGASATRAKGTAALISGLGSAAAAVPWDTFGPPKTPSTGNSFGG